MQADLLFTPCPPYFACPLQIVTIHNHPDNLKLPPGRWAVPEPNQTNSCHHTAVQAARPRDGQQSGILCTLPITAQLHMALSHSVATCLYPRPPPLPPPQLPPLPSLPLHCYAPCRYSQLKIEMADVDTADIGPHLAPAYEFIETALAGKKGEGPRRQPRCLLRAGHAACLAQAPRTAPGCAGRCSWREGLGRQAAVVAAPCRLACPATP